MKLRTKSLEEIFRDHAEPGHPLPPAQALPSPGTWLVIETDSLFEFDRREVSHFDRIAIVKKGGKLRIRRVFGVPLPWWEKVSFEVIFDYSQ